MTLRWAPVTQNWYTSVTNYNAYYKQRYFYYSVFLLLSFPTLMNYNHVFLWLENVWHTWFENVYPSILYGSIHLISFIYCAYFSIRRLTFLMTSSTPFPDIQLCIRIIFHRNCISDANSQLKIIRCISNSLWSFAKILEFDCKLPNIWDKPTEHFDIATLI